jgi:chemotaxis protein CheY-P-specific phosphatase CheC
MNIKQLFDVSFEEAAFSLSKLAGRDMNVSTISEIEYIAGEELVNRFKDDLDTLCFGSLIKVHEGILANIVLILHEADGLSLYDAMLGNREGTSREASQDIIDSIGEVNNILSSTFINNIADLLTSEVHSRTPMNQFDMLGAIMQGVILQEEIAGKKILVADTEIGEKGKKGSHARIFIMTDKIELDKILTG